MRRPAGPSKPLAGATGRSRSERLREELANYEHCETVHDLPAAHDWWAERWVLPKLKGCGFSGLDDFYVSHLAATCRMEPAIEHQILSLGAGNCDFEVGLAASLRAKGITNLHFNCIELNPRMVARGRRLADGAGIRQCFSFEVCDLDSWQPASPWSACIANHSLHHIVAIESLFAALRGSMRQGAVLLINDMIGRNGHRRWPEALPHVERIWDELPLRQRYNHQLRRLEPEFVDWDCSQYGNEGIRSQDVLPLLLENFEFEVFVAFGNLIDVFVDRSFGPNFDVACERDLQRLDDIARLDDALIDAGEIKPTHLIASLRKRPVELRCYRHWTPEFCLRRVD